MLLPVARDTRRATLPGGTKKVEQRLWTVGDAAPVDPTATPGKPYKWSARKSILDNENNGYTV